MYRIDTTSAAASRPAPEAAGLAGYFTEGNPQTATPPTTVSADWLNGIQEELLSILVAAGITPSKTNLGQVLAALRILCWTPLNDGTGSGLDADTLRGYHWQSGQDVSFGQVNAQTPNSGTTGGVRILANSTTALAYLQFLNAVGGQIGYAVVDATGKFTWSGDIWANGGAGKVWSSANDGAGSGLDADTIDGFDSSVFVRITGSDLSASGHRYYADGFKEAWGSVSVPANGSVTVTVPGAYTSWFIPTLGPFIKTTSMSQFNTGLSAKGITGGVASFTLTNEENIDLEVDWTSKGV